MRSPGTIVFFVLLVILLTMASVQYGLGRLPGDIVIGMNGRPVESVDDLHRLLSEVGIGEPARIDVLRGTERTAVEVVIAEEAA